MKRALIALESYCQQWKLKVNCSKTNIVIFSRGRVETGKYNFRFGTTDIQVVTQYKYLGLMFNYNGRFRQGELLLKQRATRAMYGLISKCRKFNLPVDMQLELFKSMVSPVMLYGAEVWGHYVIRDLEQLHLKFLKYTLHVHKYTSNDIVYGELGEYPIDISIKCAMIGYWVRLITGKSDKLSYIMYKCLLHLDHVGCFTSPWLNHIRSICNDCGLSGVWLAQNVLNPSRFRLTIEQQLKDQWIAKWNANLESKGICSNYRSYKLSFGLENYLLKLDKGERIVMSKLRASNNKFPVISGRHRNIARENRICTKCNNNEVGDEYHILLTCNNEEIVQLRNRYIANYYRNNPSQFKYILLLSNSNTTVMRNLVQFLRGAFNIYK